MGDRSGRGSQNPTMNQAMGGSNNNNNNNNNNNAYPGFRGAAAQGLAGGLGVYGAAGANDPAAAAAAAQQTRQLGLYGGLGNAAAAGLRGFGMPGQFDDGSGLAGLPGGLNAAGALGGLNAMNGLGGMQAQQTLSPNCLEKREFEIPKEISPRDYVEEFETFLDHVNAVNHGEFEVAVNKLLEQAELYESSPQGRSAALAIQRCRRGGKTFMLHGVAAMLSERLLQDTHIILISMSSKSKLDPKENAYSAICSRVAWEISGRPGSFRIFKSMYQDFSAIDTWLTAQETKVILFVDELNMIQHTQEGYSDMSSLLDNFIQQIGCSLLYSTHDRSTRDLLRGRIPTTQVLTLSKSDHLWLSIPRIVNEGDLDGILKNASYQPSFWAAVLRGRIPALVLQRPDVITNYAKDVYLEASEDQELKRCLAAVITGDINSLPNQPNLFRAYSYMSQRFSRGNDPLFAWPPFMVAQYDIIRKDYKTLRIALENPEIDEPKAFEALIQLSVLVRLLSEQYHDLVPKHPDAQASGFSASEATEMFHVSQNAMTLNDILDSVSNRYCQEPKVIQVVAVPLYASFQNYDFFLLHRVGGTWNVAVGYQCKQGSESPTEAASNEVPKSVWVEGKCRKYRVAEGGEHVQQNENKGWVLLGESNQVDFLGVSVSEALPQDPIEVHAQESSTSGTREGETSRNRGQEATLLEPELKKPKI